MKGDFESLYLIPKEVYQDIYKREGENNRQRLHQLNRDFADNNGTSEQPREDSQAGNVSGHHRTASDKKEEEQIADADGHADLQLLPQGQMREAEKKIEKEKKKKKEKNGPRTKSVKKKKTDVSPTRKARKHRIPDLQHLSAALYNSHKK